MSATTLRSSFVNTRKPHRCFGCGTIFPAKTKMWSQVNAGDGQVYTVYMCYVCEDYWSKYGNEIQEFGEGDLFDGRDHYEKYRSSLSNV